MSAKSSALRKIDTDMLPYAVSSNDWEYADSDTQTLTHNIHRYSGKFIPQIAAKAIELLTKPGELVLDPYCGSGTVLVEAALQNRSAVGIDLNPLAVLIANAKISPIRSADLNKLRKRMASCIDDLREKDSLPLFSSSSTKPISSLDVDPRLNDEWFCKWFRPTILTELVQIENELRNIEDVILRRVGLVAFSDILRKSSNAHSGYPNVMFDKNAGQRQLPSRTYLKSLDRVCDMIESISSVPGNWTGVNATLGDATALKINDCSVDTVISHPPYIGSIPYAEYGALSLKWLGYDPKDLDSRLTGGRRQSSDVVERFKSGFQKMLAEAYRVLRPGRHAFLMVGNPVVRGEIVRLDQITIELATLVGFELTTRTLRNGVNRRANKMGAEHLLFFQKPERA